MTTTKHTSRSIAKKLGKKIFKLSAAALLCMGLGLPLQVALASKLPSTINYQTFLDFARNRGQFQPGAQGIEIFDNQGHSLGRLDAPMPDWAPVSTSGYATLVAPQYIVSVKHNGSYGSVSFGDSSNSYQLVDRNNSGDTDIHTPRLNKLVTEAAPLPHIDHLVDALKNERNFFGVHSDRYSAIYRIGSGTQLLQTPEGEKWINGAYAYLTGGTVIGLSSYGGGRYFSSYTTPIDQAHNGLLPNYGLSGDSGSPIVAYDQIDKKWVIIGVLTSGGGGGTNWTTMDDQFLQQNIDEDTDAPIALNGGYGTWQFNADTGLGQINGSTMHGQVGEDLNAGKHLTLNGGGTLNLVNSVNQGAGVLTLNGNYVVSSQNDATWRGGGIILGQGAQVLWRLNGVEGDALHLIGEGTFTQQGTGINPGALKVGQGRVILDQQYDQDGHRQAFSALNINSGRATVVLMSADQVNPDTITWGYRGGTLDVNGNSLSFHQLKHSDFGAIIDNQSDRQATIELKTSLDRDQIQPLAWDGKTLTGTPGTLYSVERGGKTNYYILRKSKYWYFPDGQDSNDSWEFVGNDLEAARDKVIDANSGMIFHGQIQGNLNVVNQVDKSATGAVVFDGSVRVAGHFDKENGRLAFQGHPVLHGYVQKWQSEGLAGMGSPGVFFQPTTFDQTDWQTRVFAMDALNLKNTDFGLGRNAQLFTTINADHSKVTLGDSRVFIDLNDGNGTTHQLSEGHSRVTPDKDLAFFQGTLQAKNQSEVNLRGKFSGSLIAEDSDVRLASKYLNFDDVQLTRGKLTIAGSSVVGVNHRWQSDTNVALNDSTFMLQATATQSAIDALKAQKQGQDAQAGDQYVARATTVDAGYYQAPVWQLNGDKARIEVGAHGVLDGDVAVEGKGTLSFTGTSPMRAPTTPEQIDIVNRLNGYAHAWRGGIEGQWAQATLNDTAWLMTKNSSLENLTLNRSLISWRNGQDLQNAWSLQDSRQNPTSTFTKLTVSNLTLNDSSLMLRTDLKQSDTLQVTGQLTGQNNALYVTYVTPEGPQQGLNVRLIQAKGELGKDFFKPGTSLIGFSRVTPIFEVQQANGQSQVVLKGFTATGDRQNIASGQDVLQQGYQGFVSEVNNMNLRMGELRDNPLGAGAWVRLTQAGGSSAYSDNDWTGIQVGSDRQIRHSLGSTYVGGLVTYTHSNTTAQQYNGKGDAYGVGGYASTLFDNGLYVDAIAKYIRLNNDYTLNYAGLASQKVKNDLFYAGAEVGYRLQVTPTAFIEPQAELVVGRLGAQDFAWKQDANQISMHQDASTPILGRTGLVFGKHFEGATWKLDARLGAHYEYDIAGTGDMTLTDGALSHVTTPDRDGRFIYALGVNAQVRDNLRLGLELQRSAFGKYNLDHLVNATVRYSF